MVSYTIKRTETQCLQSIGAFYLKGDSVPFA